MFAVDEVFGMLLIEGVCFVGIVLQEDGQSGMYVLRRNLQARKSVPPQSSHQVKLREPAGSCALHVGCLRQIYTTTSRGTKGDIEDNTVPARRLFSLANGSSRKRANETEGL